MNFKNLFLAGFAFLVSPQLVQAEGAFSGFYGGVAAGYGFSGDSKITTTGQTNFFNYDLKGGQVSLLGGYNYVAGRFVLGVESDANFGKIEDSQTVELGSASRRQGTASLGNYYTLRARVGFTPTENLLLFGTAGPARGTVSNSIILTSPILINAVSPFTVVDSDKSTEGYVFGLGGEYRQSEKVAWRLEYSELSFDDVTLTQRNPGSADSKFTSDYGASFVRTAIIFKF
jgi:outer membrane immunogenic protein